MLTFNPDLLLFCHDVVTDFAPDSAGDRYADLIESALTEAQLLANSDAYLLSPTDLYSHLIQHLQSRQVEPGTAERRARLRWYRELCWDWIHSIQVDQLSGIEVECAIERAVSGANDQIRDGVWPPGNAGRDRLRWLLRKSVAKQLRGCR